MKRVLFVLAAVCVLLASTAIFVGTSNAEEVPPTDVIVPDTVTDVVEPPPAEEPVVEEPVVEEPVVDEPVVEAPDTDAPLAEAPAARVGVENDPGGPAETQTPCPESRSAAETNDNCEPPEEHKVHICHRTNAVDNPYASSTQEVDDDAVDGVEPPGNDHQGHGGAAFDPNASYPPPHNGDQWGDIIPPFYADGSPGTWTPLNWDAAGQAIFYNNCNASPPPPEVGSLDVYKVVAGEGTPVEGTEFTVEVICDSDDFDETLVFDAQGNLISGTLPITDIPDGTNCTVSETDSGGADDVEIDPADGQVEIEGDETVTVTVTNTFEEDGCEPNCPVPTAFAFSDPTPPTCEDVGNFLQQEFPGVTIIVDPAFDGPGTYTVTATLDDPNAVWEDIGGNEPRVREITVDDALGFQSDDPEAPCFLNPPPPPPPPICIDQPGGPVTDCSPPTPPVPPNFVPTCEDVPSQAGCTIDTLPRTGTDAADLGIIGLITLLLGGGTMLARKRFASQEVE